MTTPSICASVLLALAGAPCAGCGAIIEPGQVARDFTRNFACAAPAVTGTLNGYRVEGCGTTAYYTCIDTDPSSEAPLRRAKPGGGRILGALLASALLDGMEVDDCTLSAVQRGPRPPAVVALAQTPHTLAGERGLRSELPVRGGSIVLFGKPARIPSHVLLDVHASARLAPAPCDARIFDDGVPLHVLQHQRVDPYTERLLLARSALEGVKSSVRFAGEVCGFSFELDEPSRTSVALFDARFGELAAGSTAQATR